MDISYFNRVLFDMLVYSSSLGNGGDSIGQFTFLSIINFIKKE